MENLKKNIHFVVFGAGILLGIIFLGVGMYIRSGTEESLETEKANLSKLGAVPSRGSLEAAEKASKSFADSLTTAERLLNGEPGTKFIANYRQHADGRQFFSEEANAKLVQLKARFDAMEKPLKLPALLNGWQLGSGTPSNPWTQLDTDMTNPQGAEKIREQQMRLRLLDEVATTMEKLIESGADQGLGVKLRSLRFQSNFGPIGSNETESPWLALPFDLEIECAPGFAILLADELANPSQRTLTPTTAAEGKSSYTRMGFPIIIDMVQTVMLGRPHEMRMNVENADKAGVIAAVNEAMTADETKLPVPPDPAALDPNKPEGQALAEAAAKNLNDKDRMILPVHAGIRMKAAAFNKAWRAVAEPAQSQ